MQSQSDHLAFYLDRVRSLEADNWKLESEIWEHLEKTWPSSETGGHYFKTTEDLRALVFASSVDNAHLTADEFRVRCEMELAMCQSAESDINGI